jgi:hypothetical protein
MHRGTLKTEATAAARAVLADERLLVLAGRLGLDLSDLIFEPGVIACLSATTHPESDQQLLVHGQTKWL